MGADGVLVPGGFGDRGVEGKILAAKYARENRKPYLGTCLGMQVAVIEFSRCVLGLVDANGTEFDPNTRNPCVIFMPESSKTQMGCTMRLGSRRTYFKVADCKSAKLYGNKSFVDERHRHRYEEKMKLVAPWRLKLLHKKSSLILLLVTALFCLMNCTLTSSDLSYIGFVTCPLQLDLLLYFVALSTVLRNDRGYE